jgi:hypothetical protein
VHLRCGLADGTRRTAKAARDLVGPGRVLPPPTAVSAADATGEPDSGRSTGTGAMDPTAIRRRVPLWACGVGSVVKGDVVGLQARAPTDRAPPRPDLTEEMASPFD